MTKSTPRVKRTRWVPETDSMESIYGQCFASYKKRWIDNGGLLWQKLVVEVWISGVWIIEWAPVRHQLANPSALLWDELRIRVEEGLKSEGVVVENSKVPAEDTLEWYLFLNSFSGWELEGSYDGFNLAMKNVMGAAAYNGASFLVKLFCPETGEVKQGRVIRENTRVEWD